MDEVASLDWDITPKDEYKYDWVQEDIKKIKQFLTYPNKNNEPFSYLIRGLMKDILEIDAGVIVKVFDMNSYDFENLEPKSGAPMLKPKGQRKMTEIYVRDGASFLKEIDKFGFEKGYWQYSYQIPAHPMWFNKDEICYIQEHSRSMSCYGFARTQAILDIVKSLHYSTLYNKRFFEETPIPDGALSLLDTNEVEMRSFMQYWNNEFKAQPHKIAIMNKDIKWQPFATTQRELEFLETQKWYYNLVISVFGLTPAEMGITSELNRATSATQAELVKRKGIRPFLKLLEAFINKNVVDEFGVEGVEFQFIYDDPAEKKAKLDNWNMELSMGIKTVNEVRNELGLEPIAGGDVSNSIMSRMGGGFNDGGDNTNNTPDNPKDKGEEREGPGYKETLSREEGKGTKKEMKEPDPEQLKMGIEVEREHQQSLNLTDQDVEQIARDHLKEDPEYYTKLRQMEAKKGVDDGQYYHEQPISQPRRLSGAMFQPQMPVQDTMFPSALTSSQKNPLQDIQAPNKDLVHCPICNQPTLSKINAEETLTDDLRCTQCGARFNSKDLMNIPEMEEMTNILQMYNNSQPIVSNKAFTKDYDDSFDVKAYSGINTEKSFTFAREYAGTNTYLKMLFAHLKDLGKKDVKSIVDILKEAMTSSDSIYNVAQKIDEVIKDYPRAQLIARTEVIRLANIGNKMRMLEKGQEKVKWYSAPEDGRLCEECAKLNGKIYYLKDVPIPAQDTHPRCRCNFAEYEEP